MNLLEKTTDKARKVPPGFMFYLEDAKALRGLSPEDFRTVMFGLVDAIETGELLENDGSAASVAFYLLWSKTERDLQKYNETGEKRRAAANARWHLS